MYWGWITKTILFTLLATLALAFGLWFYLIRVDASTTRIVFLSVGQGDAILISQGMNQVVIDGGRDGRRLLPRLGRHVPFYDRTIETLIPSHPDADHIGGLSALLERYRVETVFDTGARTDTKSAFLFYRDLEQEGARTVPALRGTALTLPRGGKLSVLYPYGPLPADMPETNEGSVVARFEFGETSFLLTGDLPDEERFIPDLAPADVLKAAHHGSQYSTSDALLDQVRPQEAIISVGENSYGHPHASVLTRLLAHGVAIHRTDTEGDIVYTCRGDRCQRED